LNNLYYLLQLSKSANEKLCKMPQNRKYRKSRKNLKQEASYTTIYHCMHGAQEASRFTVLLPFYIIFCGICGICVFWYRVGKKQALYCRVGNIKGLNLAISAIQVTQKWLCGISTLRLLRHFCAILLENAQKRILI